MRRPLGVLLVCLAVAACGAEEDVPEPAGPDDSALPGTPFPAEVLEVRCLADGTTTVATTQVSPGRAGVRLRVVNETDGARAVLLDADRLGVTASQDAGTTVESVEALPPGRVDVECTAPGTAEQPATLADPVAVEVVDAAGLWQRTAVECPQGDEIGIPTPPGWGVFLTREQLPDELGTRTRLAPDDEIGRGGYPEQDDAPLVVVRNDRVVISATPWSWAAAGTSRRCGAASPTACSSPRRRRRCRRRTSSRRRPRRRRR